ncbi:MAG: ABC transporter substrate-binding protein [Clostridia bacterium]|nr:ABC transporter substrate-binding protein [Clostridia bacterium]
MKKLLAILLVAALAAALAVGAVAEADRDAIIIGVTNVIDKVDPTYGGNPWSLTADGISETIYMQDETGALVSHIAEDLTQVDDLTWELTLKDGVKFSDGTDLDAEAVAESMNTVMSLNPNASNTAGVITFAAKDAKTVTLTTERKTTVMKSVLTEWSNVVFKGSEADGYVFTGPYMLKDLNPGVTVELTPNPYYDDRAAERPDVTLKCFQDTTSMQQAFESGEIDMAFTVTNEIAEDLEAKGYTVKNFDAGYQYFCIPNISKAPLDDANVVKAVNLLIDREAMQIVLRGGRIATGFFATYYSFAGDVEEVTDAEAAQALLNEAGYADTDGDGYLDKDGQALELQLTTYAYRPDLPVLMQLVASSLDAAGIKVTTSIVDNIDEFLSQHTFDLAFYAQHTAPTGEPAYALNMFFRSTGSKNHGGYVNDDVDALLDQLGELEVGAERDAISKQVQAIANDDGAMIYLIDPEWHIAVSDKLADYVPYCGDYYVVNPQLGLK